MYDELEEMQMNVASNLPKNRKYYIRKWKRGCTRKTEISMNTGGNVSDNGNIDGNANGGANGNQASRRRNKHFLTTNQLSNR